MAKIDTLFMTKTAENHIFWGRTYLYNPYKGELPHPERIFCSSKMWMLPG